LARVLGRACTIYQLHLSTTNPCQMQTVVSRQYAIQPVEDIRFGSTSPTKKDSTDKSVNPPCPISDLPAVTALPSVVEIPASYIVPMAPTVLPTKSSRTESCGGNPLRFQDRHNKTVRTRETLCSTEVNCASLMGPLSSEDDGTRLIGSEFDYRLYSGQESHFGWLISALGFVQNHLDCIETGTNHLGE